LHLATYYPVAFDVGIGCEIKGVGLVLVQLALKDLCQLEELFGVKQEQERGIFPCCHWMTLSVKPFIVFAVISDGNPAM
jgi:hypothetical protein